MALRSTQPLTEMSAGSISWGKGGRCVRLKTYHHAVPLSRNLGNLTSWNPLSISMPVMGLLYFLCIDVYDIVITINSDFFPRQQKMIVLYSRKNCFLFKTLAVSLCYVGRVAQSQTGYRLDGPGSNPGGDEIFRLSRPALGPTQPPVQ